MTCIKNVFHTPFPKLKDWVKDLWVFNRQEMNVNAYQHKLLLERYLLICGYTVAEPNTKWLQDVGVYASECCADIEEISHATYEEIDHGRSRKR